MMNERLAQSARALQRLEQSVFPYGSTPRSGISLGSWWIRRSNYRRYRDIAAELSKIGLPRVPHPAFLLLLASWHDECEASCADALYFKTHARAFYLSKRLTIKFAGPHEQLQMELAARNALHTTSRVTVPAIYESFNGESPFFVEELIFNGIRIADAHITAEFANALWEFYERNGVVPQPLHRIIDPSDLSANLEGALNYMGVRVDPVMRAWNAIHKEITWDCPVPWGLCHGDLSDSNMLDRDGQLILLDWENAHRGLIFEDLAKLQSKFPMLSKLLQEPYKHWCASEKAKALRLPHLLCLCLMSAFVTHWKEVTHANSPPVKKRKLAHRLFRLQVAITQLGT